MDFIKLIGGVFAVSYSLVYLGGPLDVFSRFRSIEKIAEYGPLGCFGCTAFWVSLPVVYTHDLLTSLGVWGISIIIDQLIGALDV